MKTENSDSNLIKVNQRDIKTMLEERILNPKKYVDRPLLIWRGYFNDDIQRRVFFNFEPRIKELMDKQHQHSFNSNGDDTINTGKDEVAIPLWRQLNLDKFHDKSFHLQKKGTDPYRVFCLFFDLSEENLALSPLYKEYSDIINSDWLVREKECNSPIVVYLPFVEEPEAFKGYDQYVFTPDFDEWKKENSKHQNPLVGHLIGFLESSTSEEERNYRWYWYFQRQKEEESSSDIKSHFAGNGCDFPSCWMEGIGKLQRQFIMPMAQRPKNYIPPKPIKISEIPVDEFKAFFKVGISEDVIEDFRNYLIAHNVEIQGNK